MKQKKKQDLEFIDLDENESAYENESDYENESNYEDEYEDEYEDDYEDAYEAEYESLAGWKEFISAKVLIIIITIVIIAAAFLLFMLKRNHTEDAEGTVPAMEEMTGEGLQTEQMQDEQVQDQAGQSLPDAAGEFRRVLFRSEYAARYSGGCDRTAVLRCSSRDGRNNTWY